MHLVLLTFLICAAADPAGHVAYVGDAGTDTARVAVADLATGESVPVGPGLQDGAPRWSPDGAWLAFESGGGGARGIYVVRPDGSGGRALEHARPWNVDPRWSTDGTRVVYSAAEGPGGLGCVMVFDLNSGEEKPWGGGAQGLLRPVWMPYSQLMWALDPEAALSVPGVDMTRFLQEARMSQLNILSGALPEAVLALQLTPGGARGRGVAATAVLVTASEILPFLQFANVPPDTPPSFLWHIEPSWEKVRHDFTRKNDREFGVYPLQNRGETARIAYESNEGGDREIYVISSKARVNVTNHRAADWNPVWAPDGRRLAFESFRDGKRGIYQVFTDTALVSPLISGPGSSWSPAWSPDGAWVAFVSDRAGGESLYVARESGGDPLPLTAGSGAIAWPAWRPGQGR